MVLAMGPRNRCTFFMFGDLSDVYPRPVELLLVIGMLRLSLWKSLWDIPAQERIGARTALYWFSMSGRIDLDVR